LYRLYRFVSSVSPKPAPPARGARSPDWLKMMNPEAPAVKREAEEDWGKDRSG